MKRVIALISVACIGIPQIGCTNKTISQNSKEKTVVQHNNLRKVKVNSTKEFKEQIRKIGYKIKVTKQNNNGILLGILTRIDVDEDTIGVYEFKNNQEMEQETKKISKDGTTIGNALYEFKSVPHFYKNGTIIVNYIGDNKELIKNIEQFMGQQFAGGN